MSLCRSSHTSSEDETLEDELLRAIERDIQENARATSSAQQLPSSLVRGAASMAPGVATSPSDHFLPTRRSPPRSPHRGRRGLGVAGTGRVLAVAANPSDHTLPTRWSPPRSPHRGQASSRVPGTSGSAPRVTARTGSEEEARLQQDQASHTRSAYSARKRSALAKIPVGSDDQEQPPFAKMEGPMTGLMELTNWIEGLPNPPELPRELSTRWSLEDSVDRSQHLWFLTQKNACQIPKKTLSQSSTAPNHLLHDMIAAWRLDQMAHSSPSTADTLSIPMAPSEEQIQDILQKLYGHSVMQEQALQEIQLLSKTTKGEQPCLHKWAVLLPELIDLQKNWKSTWTQELEEQRLRIIQNLSVHRPNREILAGANQLPIVLKKIVNKLHKHGSSASSFAKVASIVAILSEFDMFRKGILDIGGLKMLRDLLKMNDATVRKEAAPAVLAIFPFDKGDLLLESPMVKDEIMILLDNLPKGPHVLRVIRDHELELVNIIMDGQNLGLLSCEGFCSAISLIKTIAQRNVDITNKVKNLEDFKKVLQILSDKRKPFLSKFQTQQIISILSERLSKKPNEQLQFLSI